MCVRYVCVEKAFDICDLMETSDDYNYIVRNNSWCDETQQLLFIPYRTEEDLRAIEENIDHVNVNNIYNGIATLNGLQPSVEQQYIEDLRERYNCDDETINSFYSDIAFNF